MVEPLTLGLTIVVSAVVSAVVASRVAKRPTYRAKQETAQGARCAVCGYQDTPEKVRKHLEDVHKAPGADYSALVEPVEAD